MTRPRKIGWFKARPCLEGEFHFLVSRGVFEELTGRQPRADECGRRDGEYRLYPELLAAACREGVEAEWTFAVRAVER